MIPRHTEYREMAHVSCLNLPNVKIRMLFSLMEFPLVAPPCNRRMSNRKMVEGGCKMSLSYHISKEILRNGSLFI